MAMQQQQQPQPQQPQPRKELKTHTAHSSTSSSIASELSVAPFAPTSKIVPSAQPPPAYVALAAASQLVTDNHTPLAEQGRNGDGLPSHLADNDTALFSTGGLAMINAFLDQTFYNFLLHAGGTSLASIQTAVEHVLKGKLARHAIASADEELEELLSDDVDDDFINPHENGNCDSKMDLEAVFWRTRLRVMVYMRLGEMEDDDEEKHVEEGQAKLNSLSSKKRLSLNTGLVSWAAAIYLTSILEFVAEQCLTIAGQAAFDRVASRRRSRASGQEQIEDRVVVEEHDVERIALSSTLGRLWRTWRKQLRNPHSRNVSGTKGHPNSTKSFSAGSQRKREKASGVAASQNQQLPQHQVHDLRRGSAASDEGSRVNTIRIHRLSQRPRALMIARRISSLDEVLGRRPSPIKEQLELESRHRSSSLPSQPRTPFVTTPEIKPPTANRPSSAPRPAEDPWKPIHYQDEDKTSKVAPATVSNGDQTKDITTADTAKGEPPLPTSERHRDDSSTASGRGSPQSLLDRAAATRQISPARASQSASPPSRAEAEAASSTKPSQTNSVESLTSIEEGGESIRSVSPTLALPNALGLQDGKAARAAPAVSTQSRSQQNESSKSSLREPALRPLQSFDREERSSVRKLSEASSRHSKPVVQQQEAYGSAYQSNTGQPDHNAKDFQDFMQGQTTVKYTLTPKTLQEIESPDSSRYKQDSDVQRPHEQRQRQMSDEDLFSVQQAVIAKMNASLKTYPPGGERAGVGLAVSSANASANRGNIGYSNGNAQGTSGSRAMGESQLGTSEQTRMTASTGVSATLQRAIDRGDIAAPKQSYSGWNSARTSTDSPRKSGGQGSAVHQWPPTVSSARKPSNTTLEPRDAGKTMLNRRGETEDLAEFLRSTGPSAAHEGSPAVKRLGPSEQYSTGHGSPLTSRTNWSKPPSMNGSVNSTTGLLVNGTQSPLLKEVRRGANEPTPTSVNARREEVGTEPTRTRRRVKDPFALPSDDEGEDELTALPSRGETLIDFLRNVEPPFSVVHGWNDPSRTGASPGRDNKAPEVTVSSGAADSPAASLQGRSIKAKGSVKSLWKKINS